MSGSATERYADEFAAVNRELVELVEGLSPEEWRQTAANAPGWDFGEDERRTVGQVALHTANQHLVQLAIVMGIADGRIAQPASPSNEDEALANPDPDPGEVARRLQEHGATAEAGLRALSDDRLGSAVTFKGWTMTCREAIEQLQIGHPRWHLASIRVTLARQR